MDRDSFMSLVEWQWMMITIFWWLILPTTTFGSSDGKFTTAVGSLGKKPLQFSYPTGIAINPVSKRVYGSESMNYQIQILNPVLTPHSIFGSHGFDQGQFDQPRGYDINLIVHRMYTLVNIVATHVYKSLLQKENTYVIRWLGDTKLNLALIQMTQNMSVIQATIEFVSLILMVHSFIHLVPKENYQDSSIALMEIRMGRFMLVIITMVVCKYSNLN